MSPQVTKQVRQSLPLLDVASGDASSMRPDHPVGPLQSWYWLIFLDGHLQVCLVFHREVFLGSRGVGCIYMCLLSIAATGRYIGKILKCRP
jgi:hypothetical protein